MLAKRMEQVASSPTLQVGLEAARLRRTGVEVIDFGAGEPDFTTPEDAKMAARAAIDANFTKYTANAGIDELKAAIANRYRVDYGVEYPAQQVIVTAGGKQALYNTSMALFGPGDEVVTHSPGWPSITEQIKLAGAQAVSVRTQAADGFRILPETIVSALTARTKWVILNSPGNPTGAVMPESDLAIIADEAASRGIWVVLDLCYERLIYEEIPHNLPKILNDRMPERTVLTGSMSKTYAMTGWRCGWVIGPAPVVAACGAIQSHTTSNVCSITQRAALGALGGSQDCVQEMLEEYRSRRDQAAEWFTADARIRLVKPNGAFYFFPDISGLLSPGGISTSAEFAQELLQQAHVAVTPGEAFGAPGFLRISYATSLEQLREGIRRLLEFINTSDRIPRLKPRPAL